MPISLPGNASGVTRLKSLGTPPAAIANTDTPVMQTQLAAGQWQTNGLIRVRMTLSKSGAVDTANLTIRVGTTGTAADTAITGFSALAALSATGRTGGYEFDLALVSATSVQKVGVMGTNASGYGAATTSALVAATAISSAATNPLFVTVILASSGATDTVTVHTGSISLVEP